MRHLNITVTGKVQGVFFRASTKKKADELGLEGFVCNQPDGSVYIEAEGSNEKLTTFVNWLAIGPPGAVVEKVDTVEADFCSMEDFIISR